MTATVNFLIEKTQKQLDRQFKNIDSIDTKSNIIIGIDVVVASIELSTIMQMNLRFANNFLLWFFVATTAVSAMFLTLSLILSIMSYKVETYKDLIEPRNAYKKWYNLDIQDAELKYLHNIIDSYEYNKLIISRKAERLKCSMFTLLLSVIFAIIAVATYISSFLLVSEIK